MKTRSTNVALKILEALFSVEENWIASCDIAEICALPPDKVARHAAKHNRTRNSAVTTIISCALYNLVKQGKVEKRKKINAKNEYRITQEGTEYIEKARSGNQ